MKLCFLSLRGRRRHSSRSSRKTSDSRSEGGCGGPVGCPVSGTGDVVQNMVAVEENKHIAKSHNDTSEGAVHCFQDEYGMIKALLIHSLCPVMKLLHTH